MRCIALCTLTSLLAAQSQWLSTTLETKVPAELGHAEVSFVLENLGPDPVRILKVSTDCACAQVTWPTEPIPTQNQGTVHAVYNTTSFKGLQRKTLSVLVQDGELEPVLQHLSLNLDVVVALRLSQELLFWTATARSAQRVSLVVAPGGTPCGITALSGLPESWSWLIAEDRQSVLIRPPENAGSFQAAVVVHTDHALAEYQALPLTVIRQ